MDADITIARNAKLEKVSELAEAKLGISPDDLEPYGHYKAKVSKKLVDSLQDKPDGKLVLVTAITPTPAGEGKTTTTIGLADAMNSIGKNTMVCVREPSLGPCFGMKGGGAGGGIGESVAAAHAHAAEAVAPCGGEADSRAYPRPVVRSGD